MQEEIVNSNAMDDMFVAFTMVQQIMTGLSNASSEEEKISIITKSVFSLLKLMAATIHMHLKVVAFNAQGIGRQVYELRKQMQDLKIDVAIFTETHLKPFMRFYIPNYYIYIGTIAYTGIRVELPLQSKGESHILMLTCLPPFIRSHRGQHTDWTY
jgi:hypothetical protein